MKQSTFIFLFCASICLSNTIESIDFFSKFNFWQQDVEESVTHEQILTPGSKVSIENTKGTISINTWRKPKILIEATKTGSEEEIRLTKIETLYTKEGASIKTVTLKPDRQCTVDYTLTIPHNATLSLAHTNKGNITIKNVSTALKAHTNYGSLTLQNVNNSVQASTKHGAINIQTETLKPSTTIFANSQRGAIKLQLPENTDAVLYAKTDKGSVTSDHLVTLEPRTLKICQTSLSELKKDVRGSLGHGGKTTIKLHTSCGNVKVLKA